MRLPRMATACAMENWSSTVMTFPFVRIVSAGGCCAPIRIEAPMNPAARSIYIHRFMVGSPFIEALGHRDYTRRVAVTRQGWLHAVRSRQRGDALGGSGDGPAIRRCSMVLSCPSQNASISSVSGRRFMRGRVVHGFTYA